MAHYKRRKCRYLGKSRRDSESFRRTRMGLKPIIVPEGPVGVSHEEWRLWWNEVHPTIWPKSSWKWTRDTPRSHDILHHNRPRRSRERAMTRGAVMDRIDLDAAIWPHSKKPVVYYW